MGATMLVPAYQVAALGSSVLSSALAVGCSRPYFFVPGLGAFALNLVISALGATAAAVLVVTVENKWDRRLWKGVACYWLFLPQLAAHYHGLLDTLKDHGVGRRSATPFVL